MTSTDPERRDIAVQIQRLSGKFRLSPHEYHEDRIHDVIARLNHDLWQNASEGALHLPREPVIEVAVTIDADGFGFPYAVLEDTVANRVDFQRMVEQADLQRLDAFTFSQLGRRGVR